MIVYDLITVAAQRVKDYFVKPTSDRLNDRLWDAIYDNSPQTCAYALKQGARTTGEKIIYAAGRGMEKIVTLLVEAGVDINARNVDSKTALNAAAQFGHTGIVEYLVSKNADLNISNRWLETPLDSARAGNYTDIIEILSKAGALTAAQIAAAPSVPVVTTLPAPADDFKASAALTRNLPMPKRFIMPQQSTLQTP